MQEILWTAVRAVLKTAGLPEDEEHDEGDGDNSTGIAMRISYYEDPKGKDTLHVEQNR
ncbi:hypothetical protein CGLO_11635 [Colletotrichum gloeosporioides Cg-14]|uniref:Uncharacterized protein n=1 Tax=Colletotrichum gloeosporioides (strain Cg-14) TaxID=1237896 RepID=T0K0B0_COLGC|nr:hypothetical protein CGLO_11635 [Colletotrichum gloeosporioides Cg-14]